MIKKSVCVTQNGSLEVWEKLPNGFWLIEMLFLKPKTVVLLVGAYSPQDVGREVLGKL